MGRRALSMRDRMNPSDRPDVPETAAAAATPAVTVPAGPPAGEGVSSPAGLAHVGALSFLVSRASPSGAFWIALAGGVALARAGAGFGARRGYGASLAAMIQTVAYLGPARLNGPLTQAITAPMMGALERRGVGRVGQFLACAAGRIVHNTLATAFYVWVIIGGLDAYVGTYDETMAKLPLLPSGTPAALIVSMLTLLGWTVVAGLVQVHVYRRGLRRWPSRAPAAALHGEALAEAPARAKRFDPRAVAVAAAVAFALLLASTDWPLLAAVAVWLGVAWAVARPDREALPAGLVLTLLLAGGSLAFSVIGGLGLEVALQRAARAALLVLVATWLRAAAGSDGVREVARRSLGRLRRVPSFAEATAILDELGTGGRLAPPGRALLATLGSARKRPLPLVDAVLDWVAVESNRLRTPVVEPPALLRASTLDAVLVLLAAAPLAALALGG